MDPDAFNHVIVIYGRTDVMPKGNTQLAKEMQKLPNLTMDLIYLHDSNEDDSNGSVQVKKRKRKKNAHIIERVSFIKSLFLSVENI